MTSTSREIAMLDSPTFRFGPLIERECTSKSRYESVAEAEQQARFTFSAGGPVLYSYQCAFCYGHHLTRTPRTE